MKRKFLVTVEMPYGVTIDDMEAYIEEAVRTWKGQMHPADPMFDLDSESVRAKHFKEPRKND